MQPAISFAHQKKREEEEEEKNSLEPGPGEEGKRERGQKKKRKTQVIIFPIWSIELRTSDSILPTLAAGELGCGSLGFKTDYETERQKE